MSKAPNIYHIHTHVKICACAIYTNPNQKKKKKRKSKLQSIHFEISLGNNILNMPRKMLMQQKQMELNKVPRTKQRNVKES